MGLGKGSETNEADFKPNKRLNLTFLGVLVSELGERIDDKTEDNIQQDNVDQYEETDIEEIPKEEVALFEITEVQTVSDSSSESQSHIEGVKEALVESVARLESSNSLVVKLSWELVGHKETESVDHDNHESESGGQHLNVLDKSPIKVSI
jgi:hypothetical protein